MASRIFKGHLIAFDALTAAAAAQQRTVYGPGCRQTRLANDLRANGHVTGRTSTDSQGTTTIYDAAGRKVGTTSIGAADLTFCTTCSRLVVVNVTSSSGPPCL